MSILLWFYDGARSYVYLKMKFKSWKVFAVLFKIFLEISASTHWVVTENGRIQSQVGKVI